MQNQTNLRRRGERTDTIEGGQSRPKFRNPQNEPNNFWSAAGAIFAQQNDVPKLSCLPANVAVPLSPAQERLWALEKSEQGFPYYHVPFAWRISGRLNVSALEKSIHFLVQRHDILRTAFPAGPDGPFQQVREMETKLQVVDVPNVSEPELLRRAQEFVSDPFDLEQGPLLRAAIYRRRAHEFWLVITVHQIIFDGTSMRVFSRELAEAYRAFSESRAPEFSPPPIRYADFAAWQRQCLNPDLTGAAAKFWANHLQKSYEPLRFPLDHPRRNIGMTPGATVPLKFSKDLISGLKDLGAEFGASPFAAFLGAFQAFLGRWTGQDDVMTLVSVAARNQPDLRNVIGLVANILPMGLDLSGQPGLAKVMERAGQMAASALSHQILPFGQILEMLPSSKGMANAPALQVMVIYNNAPLPALKLPEAEFVPNLDLDNGATKFDFILDVADSPKGVIGHLKYRSDLFEKSTVQNLIADWRAFLTETIRNPNLPVLSAPLSFEGGSRHRATSTVNSSETANVSGEAVGAPPRNELEAKLLQIWERIFNTRPIGIHDNFFGLGGHSLVAIRMLSEIERETGHKLQLCKVFQEPTIARLAQAIEHKDAMAGSAIVEIQPAGSKAPLFFVHGVGGGMFWGYANLARRLGRERPIYAFRSRGMDGLPELSRIEEMAASYVADLRKFRPSGPYYLGGYCFGGNVAYEMARQLRSQNQEVALLFLINCWANNSSYTRIRLTPGFFVKAFWNFLIRLNHQIRSGAKQPRDFFKWRATWLFKRLRAFFFPGSTRTLAVDDMVNLSGRPEHERELWRTHVASWLRYQPLPYDGSIVLFRTRGHPLVCSYDHQMGWGGLAIKGVRVRICPGDHESILEEEHVGHAASELKTILSELEVQENRNPAVPPANNYTPVADDPVRENVSSIPAATARPVGL